MATVQVNVMLAWVLSRLQEPSTWRGVALIVGTIFAGFNPDHIEQIGAAMAALIGAVEVVRKESAGQVQVNSQDQFFQMLMQNFPVLLASMSPRWATAQGPTIQEPLPTSTNTPTPAPVPRPVPETILQKVETIAEDAAPIVAAVVPEAAPVLGAVEAVASVMPKSWS